MLAVARRRTRRPRRCRGENAARIGRAAAPTASTTIDDRPSGRAACAAIVAVTPSARRRRAAASTTRRTPACSSCSWRAAHDTVAVNRTSCRRAVRRSAHGDDTLTGQRPVLRHDRRRRATTPFVSTGGDVLTGGAGVDSVDLSRARDADRRSTAAARRSAVAAFERVRRRHGATTRSGASTARRGRSSAAPGIDRDRLRRPRRRPAGQRAIPDGVRRRRRRAGEGDNIAIRRWRTSSAAPATTSSAGSPASPNVLDGGRGRRHGDVRRPRGRRSPRTSTTLANDGAARRGRPADRLRGAPRRQRRRLPDRLAGREHAGRRRRATTCSTAATARDSLLGDDGNDQLTRRLGRRRLRRRRGRRQPDGVRRPRRDASTAAAATDNAAVDVADTLAELRDRPAARRGRSTSTATASLPPQDCNDTNPAIKPGATRHPAATGSTRTARARTRSFKRVPVDRAQRVARSTTCSRRRRRSTVQERPGGRDRAADVHAAEGQEAGVPVQDAQARVGAQHEDAEPAVELQEDAAPGRHGDRGQDLARRTRSPASCASRPAAARCPRRRRSASRRARRSRGKC